MTAQTATISATHAPAAQAAARIPRPSKLRLATIMLIAVYPLITAILYIVLPLTNGWPTWARTLLIAPVMVASITYIIAPLIQRHLGWFIARMPRPVRQERSRLG